MSKLKQILKFLDFRNVNKEIRGYGYEYSLKSYILHMLIVFLIIIFAGYFYKLQMFYISILIGLTIICFPLIAMAQFNYTYQNKRFEILVSYMEQMIFSFKKKSKILDALTNTLESAEGEMKTKIEEAIKMINSGQINTYHEAFSIIEKDYQCSRIVSLHKFLISVEEIGGNYQQSINLLLDDIRSWVSRTYNYQKELKNIKGKIILTLIISLCICGTMIQIVPSDLASFKDGAVYQIVTTAMLTLLVVVFTFTQTKLNGQWLVDDMKETSDMSILKDIDKVETYDPKKARKNSLIASLLFSTCVIACVFIKNIPLVLTFSLFTVGIFYKPKMSYKTRRKKVERALNREFPLWLRDIALQLQNYVVPLAIRNSIHTASPVLQPYIRKLSEDIEKNPNSIKPYNDFLSQYNLSDLSTAMKMLYALQSLGNEEAEKQINDLVKRNQEMLAESERIRNSDTLAMIGFITALPMLAGALKLVIDLFLIFGSFFSMTGGL